METQIKPFPPPIASTEKGAPNGVAKLDTSGNLQLSAMTILSFDTQISAIALGPSATASGDYANASGPYATASGDYANASGYSATASGDYANASGYYATASGDYANASGYYATASGYGTTASGPYATASGYGTTASGPYATASGYSANASGYYANASGYYANASGPYATASVFGSIVLNAYNPIEEESVIVLESLPDVSTGVHRLLIYGAADDGVSRLQLDGGARFNSLDAGNWPTTDQLDGKTLWVDPVTNIVKRSTAT
jgi:hypothetical protein